MRHFMHNFFFSQRLTLIIFTDYMAIPIADKA